MLIFTMSPKIHIGALSRNTSYSAYHPFDAIGLPNPVTPLKEDVATIPVCVVEMGADVMIPSHMEFDHISRIQRVAENDHPKFVLNWRVKPESTSPVLVSVFVTLIFQRY